MEFSRVRVYEASRRACFAQYLGEFGSFAVTQVCGEDEIVAALFKRPLSIEKSRFVRLATPFKPFGDVCRNRYGGLPKL